MAPATDSFTLSDPLTIADLERLYYDVVLTHDFYSGAYGADWNEAPYDEMASLLSTTLGPRQHVDVGCGKGFLVLAMRRRGIASFGVDFSAALLNQAPPEIRSFLTVENAENWIRAGAFQGADLITYMEVFEHLPIKVVRAILETLFANFAGKLFITTPSYGIDERWKMGIITNPGTPSWQKDMARNVPFHQIVLEKGLPHHGHITLASYRWWTEFFLLTGWVRALDLESNVSSAFGEVLRKYNWNPYVLERLVPESFAIDISSSNQLGTGWHAAEHPGTASAGRWTNGRSEIYLNCLKANWTAIEIAFTAPDANVVRDYNFTVAIDGQVTNDEYQLGWESLFVSRPVPIASLQADKVVRIDINWSEAQVDWTGNRVLRLVLLSPSFCPRDYGLSTDGRTLGLFIHEIAIRT